MTFQSSTAANTGISVGVASTKVLDMNDKRKEFSLVNDSVNTVYVCLAGTAVINTGIRLNGYGGSYSNSNYTGRVSAIAGTAASVLTVCEL